MNLPDIWLVEGAETDAHFTCDRGQEKAKEKRCEKSSTCNCGNLDHVLGKKEIL